MKPQTRTLARYAAIFIAGLMVMAIYVQAQGPTSTFYISQGIYPGAPSFTVWEEGGSYFAKNANGQIVYSGTNASQVTQSALDAGQGTVFFRQGQYFFDGKITLGAYDVLAGEGKSSILNATTALNPFIESLTNNYWGIHDLTIDGNNLAGMLVFALSGGVAEIRGCMFRNADYGVDYGGGYISIIGNHFYNFAERAINNDGGGGTVQGNTFQCVENAVTFTGSAGRVSVTGNNIEYGLNAATSVAIRGHLIFPLQDLLSIVGNDINKGGSTQAFAIGIYISGTYPTVNSTSATIVGNVIRNCTLYGIGIDNAMGITLSGNSVTMSGFSNLHTNNAHFITSTGNTWADAGVDTIWYGVQLENSKHNTFVGDTIVETRSIDAGAIRQWGFRESGTSDYNTFIGTNAYYVRGNQGVVLAGANSNANLFWNGTTWVP